MSEQQERVGVWVDQSGSGNHFTQVTEASRPEPAPVDPLAAVTAERDALRAFVERWDTYAAARDAIRTEANRPGDVAAFFAELDATMDAEKLVDEARAALASVPA